MNDASIWQPKQANSSQMQGFIEYVNRNHQLQLASYDSLYLWSINEPAAFWMSVAKFCQIKFDTQPQQTLRTAQHIKDTQWFPGAKLNFAENLLKRNDHHPALLFCNERGQRRSLSYEKLHQEVARVADGMKRLGIKTGDVVAGYLPNMPETVIAMLATASLGGIWSSCSPDFGLQAVVERFSQIKPRLLFACDGQFYNGKSHDCLAKLEQIESALPSLKKTVLVPYLEQAPDKLGLADRQLYNDFGSPDAKLSFTPLDFNAPLYILFSSGTTGIPKCITHSVGGTLIQHLKELVLHTDLRADETLFYYTTCGWMMWNWMVSSLAVGAQLLLYDGSPTFPHAGYLFDILQNEGVNVFGTSAKYITAIEKNGVVPAFSHQLPKLRTILSTGSPLSPANYDYVYKDIKPDVQLCSISGGTDILSCFALGNPLLPIYRGELQCIGLGMAVQVFDDQGHAVLKQKGELVCTQSFPSMPIGFYNDSDGQKYFEAYYNVFDNVWVHGDFAEITDHGGIVIHGRSDAILNPGGVRIGTAEIYRQVEKIEDVLDCVAIGQAWQDDIRVVLFVKLRLGLKLSDSLIDTIKSTIRKHTTSRHVPSLILQVEDIPRTVSGKIVELAVKNTVEGKPVKNIDALANPEALNEFKNRAELIKEPS